ncbi:prolipoprotein diacylglyceryl transferase [Alkalicoccus saliphilus]|uniref:Prolipoprotein diacylglyceryl transferase n=1 Tax=Alkalicoccus saliphilus TaxID=200989 RepID=A0A2T4U6P1_9BACI|nr:prolipoprotein diacylglyceryl transferase family protein [Alkalicoccus saliphilus]PTL39073.1 hypothetical protein C6Y45_07780 [Alkalicoccus saliphilus]
MSLLQKPLSWLQNHPVLYKGQHFHVVGFGVFASLNAMTILSVFLFYIHWNGYPPGLLELWLLPLSLVFVWLGARAMHLISLGRKFWENPLKYLKETCFYLQGGIAGAFLWSIIFALITSIPTSIIWDGLALGTLAGQVFGRIGCFNYGCCFGKETHLPIGFDYQNQDSKILRIHPHLKGKPVHPAQLYKAGMNAVAALTIVVLLSTTGLPHGVLVVFFFIYHGMSRIVFEYFRYDIYIHHARNWITYRFALIAIVCGGILGIAGPYIDANFYALSPRENTFIPSFFSYYFQNIGMAVVIGSIGIVVFISYGIHGKKLGTLPFTNREANTVEEKSDYYRSRPLRNKSRL